MHTHAHVCTRLPHPLTLPFKLLLPPVLSLSFRFYSDSLNLQPADLQIPAETLQPGYQKAEATSDSLGCLSRELLIPADGPGAQETAGATLTVPLATVSKTLHPHQSLSQPLSPGLMTLARGPGGRKHRGHGAEDTGPGGPDPSRLTSPRPPAPFTSARLRPARGHGDPASSPGIMAAAFRCAAGRPQTRRGPACHCAGCCSCLALWTLGDLSGKLYTILSQNVV